MYVCNCNGITDREVKVALCAGASKWDDVHEYFDCEPACGKCECEINEAMAQHRAESEPSTQPIFAAPALSPAV